jgi:Flp pilus assembly protein TadD
MLAALLALVGCGGLPKTEEQNMADDHRSKYAQALRMADNVGRNGDPAAARIFYERAAALQPNDLEPQVGLAESAASAGDFAQSAAAYRKAMAIAPTRAEFIYGHARGLLMTGETAHAIEQFSRYIRSKPEDPRGYIGLGIAHDISGAHAAAQTAYLDGLQAAPDNMALRNNLALSLALADESEDAVGILRELAQEPGAAARVRQTLALVYAISGRMDAATDLVRQSVSSAEARNTIAFLRSLQGLRGPALAEAVLFGRVSRVAAAGYAGDGRPFSAN